MGYQFTMKMKENVLLIIPWIWGGVGSWSEKAKEPGQHKGCVAEQDPAQDSVCCPVTDTSGYTLPGKRVIFLWKLDIDTKLFQNNYLLLMSPRSQ